MAGSSCELTIVKFVNPLINLIDIMQGKQGAFPAGFDLRIEVKDEERFLSE